jgi:hypothetical protein
MSKNGPTPLAKRNSGLGWKMSGPGYCMTAWADRGSPMLQLRPRARSAPLAGHGVCSNTDQKSGRIGLVKKCASTSAVDTDRLL